MQLVPDAAHAFDAVTDAAEEVMQLVPDAAAATAAGAADAAGRTMFWLKLLPKAKLGRLVFSMFG